MCSLTKFTMPIRKQTKDDYPNKLTDCQNRLRILISIQWGENKTKQNKNKGKQMLYCFHTLFRDRGCKPMKVNKNLLIHILLSFVRFL